MQAPQPLEPWGDEVRDAVEFGPSCPQMIFESDNRLKPHDEDDNPHDEDCLYLNIYSPYQVSSLHTASVVVTRGPSSG